MLSCIKIECLAEEKFYIHKAKINYSTSVALNLKKI